MLFRRHEAGTDARVSDLRKELSTVSDAARAGDCDAARSAIALRHRIGIAEIADPVPGTGFVEPASAPTGADGLPEVQAGELSAATVRGAILDGGCLLVRGLFDEDTATRLARGVDRALDARDATARGDRADCGHFEHLEADASYELQERYWVESAGGLWTADSPFLAAEIYGLFGDLGVVSLGHEYLGEQPVLTVQKGTLRKVSPTNEVISSIVSQGAGGGWHQDGKFLGSAKALNVWISLSRCGDDLSPGMDLVPRRLAELVATGTEGAPLDWTVADDVARRGRG